MNRITLILKTIQKNPGIHTRQISKVCKLENGVTCHYLEKLEKLNVIKSQKDGKYRRYFSVGIEENEFPVITNIIKDSKREILFMIAIYGQPTFKMITSKIGKSQSTISYHLSGLIKEGLVEKIERDGEFIYAIKNKKFLGKIILKEFSGLFKNRKGHMEDIFLAL